MSGARAIELERPPRAVRVHELTVESLQGEVLTVVVHCGKGLYVRTLAEDIGAALGCGAYLQALRHLKVGPFQLEQAVGLSELEALDLVGRDARLKPVDILVADLPRMDLDVDAAWHSAMARPSGDPAWPWASVSPYSIRPRAFSAWPRSTTTPAAGDRGRLPP